MSQSLIQISTVLETYDFNFHNLTDRLKCVICHLILKNAKQTSCGCKVCEKCITNYLSDGPKKCPGNQPDCSISLNANEDIHQDNATNKEIGNLKVKCPFNLCHQSNALRNMVEHIQNCEFREIVCEKCNNKCIANEKLNHDRKVCEMRDVQCPHCNKTMKHQQFASVHLDPDSDELCTKYIAICPNNCSVKNKVNLKEHLKDCVNKKLECPFHSFNCNIGKVQKEYLSKHIQDEFIGHISSLVDTIKTMEGQIVALQSELESQKQITLELFNMNKKSSESHLKMEKSVDELKKKGPTSIQTVDRSVIFRNANFIWKFTDFESRRTDAESGIRVSVTSDPFYTSDFGYKMCLRIYPAGDGVGKGTHLSVFFAIMKGDFDDLLAWPFKQKVTLSILDQDGGTKHHSDTFKPDSRSACYQKPSDECNIASGSPKFISLPLVMADDSIYRKNDTIYLKINVDTIGISKP